MASQAILRNAPFFNYPHVFTSQEEDFVSIFRDLGHCIAFVMQRDLRDSERDLCTTCRKSPKQLVWE